MERAEAEELLADLAEADVLADDLDEVGPGSNLLLGVVRANHRRH